MIERASIDDAYLDLTQMVATEMQAEDLKGTPTTQCSPTIEYESIIAGEGISFRACLEPYILYIIRQRQHCYFGLPNYNRSKNCG